VTPRLLSFAVGALIAASSVVSCTAGHNATLAADASGALSLQVEGTDLRIIADPGTFPPGQPVQIRPLSSAPAITGATPLGTAVEIASSSPPAHPMTVEAPAPDGAGAVAASIWDTATGAPRPVGVAPDGGLVRAGITGLGGFSFYTFPSPDDESKWIVQQGVQYLGDFFDAPYECSPPDVGSDLVDVVDRPVSVNLQVDVLDRDASKHTVAVRLCNKLRFAMAYRSTGAAEIAGFTLPRSEFSHDTVLAGEAGDPLTIGATFSPEAVVATAAMFFFEIVSPTAGLSRTLHWGLVNAEAITLIADSARSCASAVEAARAQPTPTSWEPALACLGALDTFPRLVLELVRDQALDELRDAAVDRAVAVAQGPLNLALRSQPLIRLGLEKLFFGTPPDLSFPYRLRCSTAVSCAPRFAPQPAGIDAANHHYSVSCNGETGQPVDVDVAAGSGTMPLADGSNLQVDVVKAVHADITGDARVDDAVLLSCSVQPSNFTVPVIVVLPGDGAPAVELPMIDPIKGGYPIPQYPYDEFDVQSGWLQTGVREYAADESHADEPSLHYLYRWHWTNGTPSAERSPDAEEPTMDVAAFALQTARAKGHDRSVLAKVSCPEPAQRPTGATVLCELVPTTGPAEPGYVAVRVVDAGRKRADGLLLAGDVACNDIPEWASALQNRTSGFLCGE
jgi:hypothetical protein